LLLTGISVFLCGCPGAALLLSGVANLIEALGRMTNLGEFFTNFTISHLRGGWMVCLSSLLLLVPLSLVVFLLVKRDKGTLLTSLEPTGASQDDPIPLTH